MTYWQAWNLRLSEGDLLLMPDAKLSTMHALLNESESRLVASSRGAALMSASAGELKKKIARARTLRDKWRDVYAGQRRGTQEARTSRASSANRRSREKSEVFAAALARFEARLEKVDASGPASGGGRTAARPTRQKRTRQHRQERSRTKQTLADTVADRESAEAWSARASLPSMQTRTPAKKKTAKAKKKAGATRSKKAAVARPSRPAKTQARDQSRSAAARHRTRMSGLTTRIRGHVSGRGKRAQARRDRR
jgi:hypothetical protein